MSIGKISIPKKERFMDDYKRPLCDSIYEIPDCKNTKSTGMGFGSRREIINAKETENMPSPLNYKHSSIFEENYRKSRGCSLSQRLNYKVSNIFLFNKISQIYFVGKWFKKFARATGLWKEWEMA